MTDGSTQSNQSRIAIKKLEEEIRLLTGSVTNAYHLLKQHKQALEVILDLLTPEQREATVHVLKNMTPIEELPVVRKIEQLEEEQKEEDEIALMQAQIVARRVAMQEKKNAETNAAIAAAKQAGLHDIGIK